jgi:menaquinone-dependent protoporphyrinogen oxidase
MSVMIVYGTVEGQSRRVAEFAAKVACETGLEVQLLDTADSDSRPSFEGVDRIVAAASVHQRRHPELFEVFVALHCKSLAARSTMMLSISLSAAFPEKLEEAQDYLDEMKMRTGLRPTAEMLVPGAIRGASYDYFETQVLRHVVLRGSDAACDLRDREFTDWAALRAELEAFYSRQPVVI